MAGRGNLLRQFLQATKGESSEGGSGSASEPKVDSGLDTNSPSMTIRSQGRGKILDYHISQSSSSDGAGLPIAGRGRALLTTLGRGSSGSNVAGGDDSDSAVGSAIGSVPLPTSGRGGVGRGNFFKCLQMMGDVCIEKKEEASTPAEVSNISLAKAKETSKDEAISSMEVSVPEEVPKDPVIMKGRAGEFYVRVTNWMFFSF